MNLAEMMRPKTLDEVIGNEHIVIPLRQQLKEHALSQTIMFTGQYGSGKTTFAKIIVHELEADATEIDGGSEGTIDVIRQLITSATHSSLFAPKKVFIMDEVHKFSPAAQTALLKTLEEPNDKVHFILLTNEPLKLLKTVQSRCVTYETRPATPAQIGIVVDRVKKRFGITFESNKDFWPVIEISEGSFRAVYSLLEKLIASANATGFVSSEVFRNIIGSYKEEKSTNENLPRALKERDMDAALSALQNAMERSNPVATLLGIYRYLRQGYIEKWARTEHVRSILADITPLTSSKLVNWSDIEILIWKYI